MNEVTLGWPIMAEKEQKKSITIKEFRMWLQGVEEMQGQDWSPDANQWKRIRDKIDQIDDIVVQQRAAYQEAQYGYGANPASHAREMPPVQAGPSMLTPTPQMPNAPRQAMTAGGLPISISNGPLGTGDNARTKTPDIDTSSGSYQPAFI